MRFFAVLAAFVVAAAPALAIPSSNSTNFDRAALYGNNCKGSGLCGDVNIRSDCQKAIATVNPGATYTDQAQFSTGSCYMIYATNGAGQQPVSGQVIIDTANTILGHCSNTCGSYGTNNAGCSSCHVTLNYRA